jgi:hypothetical protein
LSLRLETTFFLRILGFLPNVEFHMSHIIFFEKYIITECTIIFLVGEGEGERDNGTICEGVEAPVKIFRVLKRLRSSSTVIYKKTVTLHVSDGMDE